MIILSLVISYEAHCVLQDRSQLMEQPHFYAEPITSRGLRPYERLFKSLLLEGDESHNNLQDMESNRTRLRTVGVDIDDTLYKLVLTRILSTIFDRLSVTFETQIDALSIEYLHSRFLYEE